MSSDFQPSQTNSTQSKPGCARFIPALFAVMLVMTPIVFYSCGTELNKWRIAAATEKLYNDGYDAAISSISHSLESDPDSPELLFQRSTWYEQTEQYQSALEDIDRCIESAKSLGWDPQALDRLERHRAEVLIDLQKNDEAEKSLSRIAEYNLKWLGDEQQNDWEAEERQAAAKFRNLFAYFCARADRKIDEASKYIDWAVKDYDSMAQNYHLCAFVYAQLGKDDRAAEMYSKVVEIVDGKFKLAQRQLLKTATASLAYGVPPQGDHSSEILSRLNDYQDAVSTLRSALRARSQVYERLNQQDKADADRKDADQLGEAHVAKSNSRLSMGDTLQHLSTSSAYIDTRGCVRFRRGQFAEALQDFNYALEVQQLIDVWIQQKRSRPFELIDPRQQRFATKEYQRGMATLLYHRALTKRRLNDSRGAELDENKIRDLGFEPGPTLF